MKKMMKRLRCQKGVAAIEFALIFPVLLVIIFGIIEFSLLLYDKQVITNASREGARAGIVAGRLDAVDIKSVVTNYVTSNLVTFGTPNAPVTTGFPLPEGSIGMARGDYLTVLVSYDYEFLVLPNFVASLGGVKTIQAQTVMRVE